MEEFFSGEKKNESGTAVCEPWKKVAVSGRRGGIIFL